MIVRKVFPSGAVRAVVLAHRSPLPLGEIRPPPFPMLLTATRLFQPAVFNRLYSRHELLNCGRWQNATNVFSHLWRRETHPLIPSCLARHVIVLASNGQSI